MLWVTFLRLTNYKKTSLRGNSCPKYAKDNANYRIPK